jgi:predicted PurR-regulated permease PerM
MIARHDAPKINAGLACVVWLALWLLGLPYAGWWGLTAGFANFIPYIGPLVTAVLIFGASVLAFDTLGYAFVPPLVFITLTSIEGYLVTPTILGRRLSLNPLVVFVWLVFWGWMWGIPGALLAVPLLLCFKIVCDHVETLEPISHLLSGYVRRLGENNDA